MNHKIILEAAAAIKAKLNSFSEKERESFKMDPVLAWQMERANDRKKLSQIVIELEKMLEPHLKKMDELSVSLPQKKKKDEREGRREEEQSQLQFKNLWQCFPHFITRSKCYRAAGILRVVVVVV